MTGAPKVKKVGSMEASCSMNTQGFSQEHLRQESIEKVFESWLCTISSKSSFLNGPNNPFHIEVHVPSKSKSKCIELFCH